MKNSKVLHWILALGVVIVLNLFFHFAVRLVYEPVRWEDFCARRQVTIQPPTAAECLAVGGAWTDNPRPVKIMPEAPMESGWCDPNFTCQKEFDQASQVYNRNVFVALVILGLAVLVMGLY